MQLDIGNLFDGGAVALDVVNQFPRKTERNVHVKDVKKAVCLENMRARLSEMGWPMSEKFLHS